MILYNLYEYLRVKFSDKDFVTDGWEEDAKDDSILLTDSGGTPEHWMPTEELMVQIISRSLEKPVAKIALNDIYLELKNKFRLVLPEITVSGKVFPEVTTAQISPIQTPSYIGVDDNKHHLYTFNIKIVIGG